MCETCLQIIGVASELQGCMRVCVCVCVCVGRGNGKILAARPIVGLITWSLLQIAVLL